MHESPEPAMIRNEDTLVSGYPVRTAGLALLRHRS